jgi:cysteine desulfurase
MVRVYRKKNGSAYPFFHSDACQAPLFLNLQRENLRVDLMSLDGHKIYGPRGVGILFVSSGVKIQPIFFGGGQERGLRPTTENIPGIVGISLALGKASRERESFSLKMKSIRDLFIHEVENNFPEAILNGSRNRRTPNNANFSFLWIKDAEFAVIWLSEKGIACSTKSSCLKDEDESYVIKALDPSHPLRAKTALRFSFGVKNSKRDIIKIVKTLKNLKEFLSKNSTIAKNR